MIPKGQCSDAYMLRANISKTAADRGWLQMTINEKWHMAN